MKLGWFSTGRDAAARQLLCSVIDAKLPLSIEFVFCNRCSGEAKESDDFIDLVHYYNLPLVTLSSHKFMPQLYKEDREKWRRLYDTKVCELIESFEFDLVMLSGYMLILSPILCERYKFLNLHPALPTGPIGTWENVINQLIQTHQREAGMMVHIATPQLDRGPVITYLRYFIPQEFEPLWQEEDKTKLFYKIRQIHVAYELPFLVKTLEFLSNGTIDLDRLPPGGYDLTDYVSGI